MVSFSLLTCSLLILAMESLTVPARIISQDARPVEHVSHPSLRSQVLAEHIPGVEFVGPSPTLREPVGDVVSNVFPPLSTPTIIAQLIAANSDVWTQFLNNKFIVTGLVSDNTAFGAYYKKYLMQDYLYLLDNLIWKTTAILRNPNNKYNPNGLQTAGDTVTKYLGYAADTKTYLVSTMGVNPAEFQTLTANMAERAYTSWETQVATTEDYYTFLVSSIPCIWGWTAAANYLEATISPGNIKTNTYFYNNWYKSSLDPTSANKLAATIEASLAAYDSPENRKKWMNVFRTSALMEIALFESAFLNY